MMNLDPRLTREAQGARRRLGLTVGLGAAAGLATVLQARVLSRTVSQVFLEGQTLASVRLLLGGLLLIALGLLHVGWWRLVGKERAAA